VFPAQPRRARHQGANALRHCKATPQAKILELRATSLKRLRLVGDWVFPGELCCLWKILITNPHDVF
jgi:hypothetical protein